MTLQKTQWLTKPDGNIIETLTDTRVVATAVGAAAGAVIEKFLWTHARDTFGVASLENGRMHFYAPDQNGKAGAESGKLGINRQIARLGIIVGCAAGIEYVPNGQAQYAFLGLAAVAMAHIWQDTFPAALR